MIDFSTLASGVGVKMSCSKVIYGLTVDTYFLNFRTIADGLKLNRVLKIVKMKYPNAQKIDNGDADLVLQVPKKDRQFYNFEQLKLETVKGQHIGDFFCGYDTENKPIMINLKQTKSIFIAGSTGGGKSCTMNNIICSLMLSTPKIQQVFIDPKKVELMRYKNVRFLSSSIFADDKRSALAALQWAVNQIKSRYAELQSNGKSSADFDELPPIVIYIDELAQIVGKEQDSIYKLVNFILCVGRAANVFILGATQVPKSIDNELRSNCPSKIALRCDNIPQSVSLVGTSDAARLQGYGDALLKIDGVAGFTRVQFPNFTDETFRIIYGQYIE